MQFEIVNPSDAATCEAPSDALAVAAVALLSEGRYSARREGFSGPLFLFSGQDEWFVEHTQTDFVTFAVANKAPIADVLASVKLVRAPTSLNDIVGRAHKMAEQLRRQVAEADAKRAADARPDLAAIDMRCSACDRPMRLHSAGPRGGTWTCDHCNPPGNPATIDAEEG